MNLQQQKIFSKMALSQESMNKNNLTNFFQRNVSVVEKLEYQKILTSNVNHVIVNSTITSQKQKML